MRGMVLAAALAAGFGGAALAQEVTADEQAKIMAALAEMKCEMDPADIEKADGGYELDDVFCADGQYDIDLNADLEVTNRRKE